MSELPLSPTVGRAGSASLEQRVGLLETANHHLVNLLTMARCEIARLKGEDPQQVLDELLKQLNELPATGEAGDEEGEAGSAEEENPESSPPGADEKQRGHGPREQPELPVVEEVHELGSDERECEVCGKEMTPMGEQFEEYEEVSVVHIQYVVKKVKRRKYRCRCNANVKTAPGPKRLIPGGRYDLDFALHVAENKYLDHLPLERQVRQMARYDLFVTSQTLWDQILALAKLLRPTYGALGEMTLASPILHADETCWPFLDGKRSPWFVWTRSTPTIAHFTILSTKSTRAARRLFKGYRGTIVADGFQVYEKLARENPDLDLAHCWAHVRRKFSDIEQNFPKECQKILRLIGDLYAVETEVPGPFPGDGVVQRERARLRALKSAPVLDRIKLWAETETGLPKSALGGAVRYMYKRWGSLTRFLDNPMIPLDNNAAERSLRGPVVGRKNHYGSKSKTGTKVAAIFYTLFETAKLCGVNPTLYMKSAAERALVNPGTVTFPWELGPLGQVLADASQAAGSATPQPEDGPQGRQPAPSD